MRQSLWQALESRAATSVMQDDSSSTPAAKQQASSSASTLERASSPPHDESQADVSLHAIDAPRFQIAASPAPSMPTFPRRELDTVLAAASKPVVVDPAQAAGSRSSANQQTQNATHFKHFRDRKDSRSSTETLSDGNDAASVGGVSFDDETPSSPAVQAPSLPSLNAAGEFENTPNDFDDLELAAATIDQLQAALQLSNQRCEQLAAAYAAQESAAEGSSRKLARASAKNKELSGAIKILRSRLRDSKALTDALRAKQEGGQAQGARTEAAMAEMQRRVETERTAAEDAQQAVQRARQELQDCTHQLTEAKRSAAAAAADRATAQSEASTAVAELQDVQQQLARAQAQMDETKQQLQHSATQAAALRNTIAEQADALAEAKAACAALQQDVTAQATRADAAQAVAAAEQAQHDVTRAALRAAENCAMGAEDEAATWHRRTERLMRAYSAAAVASEQVQQQLRAVVEEREGTVFKLRKQVQRMPQLAEAATQAKRREAITSGKLMEASASAQGWFDEAKKAKHALAKAESRNKQLQEELEEHADDETCLHRNANTALAAAHEREHTAVQEAAEEKQKLQALQGTHRNTVDGMRSLRVQVQQLREQLDEAHAGTHAAERRNIALQSALQGMRHASSRAVAAAGAIAASNATSPAVPHAAGWDAEQLPPGTRPSDILRLLAAVTSELKALGSRGGGGHLASSAKQPPPSSPQAWGSGGSSAPLSPVALLRASGLAAGAFRAPPPSDHSP